MAADVASHAEVIRLASERLPFETVRLSFAGPLQQPPFGLEQTSEPPHHTVWLPREYDDATLQQLVDLFGPPLPRRAVEDMEQSASG